MAEKSFKGFLRDMAGRESGATKQARYDRLGAGTKATFAPVAAPTPIQTALAEPRESQDTSFGNAQRYAEAAAGSDANLRAALNSRAVESGDLLAERFNMGGQAPTAGVFQDALARDVGRQSLEASLARQQAIADSTERMFGQGRGETVDLAKTNAGAENTTRGFNATQALDTSFRNSDNALRTSLYNAGNQAGLNQTAYDEEMGELAEKREASPWEQGKKQVGEARGFMKGLFMKKAGGGGV